MANKNMFNPYKWNYFTLLLTGDFVPTKSLGNLL